MPVRYTAMPRRAPASMLLAFLLILTALFGLAACGSVQGSWPDGQYAGRVPEPDRVTTRIRDETDNGYLIDVSWTIAEAKDYARKIKDAGFTRNATEEEQAGVYDYTSDDGTVKVSISALPGDNGAININKLQ